MIDSILSEESRLLSEKVNILLEDNVYFLNNFILFGKGKEARDVYDKEYNNRLLASVCVDLIIVCNIKGEFITDFKIGSFNYSKHNISIKEYFVNTLNEHKENIDNYSKQKIDIVELNKFWHYEKLFPYVINVLNTNNINPLSPKAHKYFYIHFIIIAVFGFSMLASAADKIFKRNSENGTFHEHEKVITSENGNTVKNKKSKKVKSKKNK